ncbi:hypothetical protein [Pectobacterium aquaticum]|uniref:hypothetical protein n=1 Tax=Pectobacterium aquaticum TaxID=2204145 RepID=UPI001F0DF660|nr:hypothetical protein [Pectobacterium aquaticum]MCH5052444.1 hypothetical protein [Pectobacterium aquaticum]
MNQKKDQNKNAPLKKRKCIFTLVLPAEAVARRDKNRLVQLVVLRRNISMRRWSHAIYSGELIDLDHKP